MHEVSANSFCSFFVERDRSLGCVAYSVGEKFALEYFHFSCLVLREFNARERERERPWHSF